MMFFIPAWFRLTNAATILRPVEFGFERTHCQLSSVSSDICNKKVTITVWWLGHGVVIMMTKLQLQFLWVIVCHGELIVNHWDHMLVTALSQEDCAPSEVTPSHREFSVWQTADSSPGQQLGRSKLPSCGTVIDSESRYPLYYATISSITGPNHNFTPLYSLYT